MTVTIPLGWRSSRTEVTNGMMPVRTFGASHALGGACVVAAGDRDVGDLEVGVAAGLAVLCLHQVHECVLVVEHQVVHRQEDPGTFADRPGRPLLLGHCGTFTRSDHVVLVALGQLRHHSTVEGSMRGDRTHSPTS